MKKMNIKFSIIFVLVMIISCLFACTSNEYIVKYFNEIPDGTYVESKIEKLLTNDTIVNFEPAEKDHYNVNLYKSKLTGDFSTGAPVVIEVYYDAERYNVTFDIGNLELVSGNLKQTVFYGEDAIAPEVKNTDKAKFSNWDVSFENVESDIVVKAICDTKTEVEVYHKLENIDGSFITIKDKTVPADAALGEFTYTPEDIDHFTCNIEESDLTCNLSLSEKNSVTVVYYRNVYTVKFDIGDLELVSGSLEQKVKSGDNAIAPVVNNNDKAKFVKWDIKFENVKGDLLVKAVCDTKAEVEVYHKLENLDGTFTTVKETTLTKDATQLTFTYTPKAVEHYSFKTEESELTCNLSVNKTNSVTVVYYRNTYTVKFNIGELELVNGELEQKVKYGASATAPEVKDTNKCSFTSWDVEYNEISSDITVNAILKTDALVKLEIYKENLNGDYDKQEQELFASTLNNNYTYQAQTINNYNLNNEKSNLTIIPDMLNVKVITVYYDLVRFSVTFEIGDLSHIGGGDLKQSIPYGGSAIEPLVSGVRTSEFKSWNKQFNNITSDTEIKAICTSDSKVTITPYFENLSGGYTQGEKTTITVSALPETYTYEPVPVAGYVVNTTLGNNTCPLYAGKEENINIYFDLKKYTVTFVFDDLTLVSGDTVQTVRHGGAAIAPVLENTTTVIFNKWDKEFDSVTSDLIITAVCDVYTPVASRADLECIALDMSGNYILAADINLSSALWTPLEKPFAGKFLGNGYTISGLRFSGQNQTGLFNLNKGVIDGLTLKDCSMEYSVSNATNWGLAGSFIAYNNSGVIKNCRVIGSNSFNFSYYTSQSIGCYSDGAFTHYNWANTFKAGAISCYNNGTIENCSLEGSLNFSMHTDLYYKFNTWLYTNVGSGSFTITSNGVFGGYCAENNGLIEKCTSSANIKSYNSSKSVSETSGSGRNDAYSNTKVTFGTITALNNKDINGCRTLVATIDTSSRSTNCEEAHAYISVTSDSSIKGLVGQNYGSITSSVATTS